jgi:protein-disulfide isomerase
MHAKFAFRLSILAVAALFSIGAGERPLGPPAKGNWLTTLSVTPAGSHVIGNPAAPVKLVEYISYTCPHCAHFQRESEGPLQLLFIQPGKVQVEVRHLIRDPIDMTVALLTNCGAPARFALNHSVFLRAQDTWIAHIPDDAAKRVRWTTGTNPARMRAIASDLGFYAIMAQRGYDHPTVDRCLGDEALARRLAAQTQSAQAAGITGTPGFLLNGLLLAGTYDWPSLKPQIEARL